MIKSLQQQVADLKKMSKNGQIGKPVAKIVMPKVVRKATSPMKPLKKYSP